MDSDINPQFSNNIHLFPTNNTISKKKLYFIAQFSRYHNIVLKIYNLIQNFKNIPAFRAIIIRVSIFAHFLLTINPVIQFKDNLSCSTTENRRPSHYPDKKFIYIILRTNFILISYCFHMFSFTNFFRSVCEALFAAAQFIFNSQHKQEQAFLLPLFLPVCNTLRAEYFFNGVYQKAYSIVHPRIIFVYHRSIVIKIMVMQRFL